MDDQVPLTRDASFLSSILPLVPTYAHLIFTALIPIITGAHASITRPNNVRPPQHSRPRGKEAASAPHDDDDPDDDEQESSPIETLTPKDAILFPVTAGIMLGGLYLIIKSLDDITILSRIFTYYFTLVGLFAVGKFSADALGLFVSVIFPRRWSQEANGKRRVYIAAHDRYKLYLVAEEKAEDGVETEKLNPFPKSLIRIPQSLYAPLWGLRRSLLAKWAVVLKLGVGEEGAARTTFWVGDVAGLVLGLICVAGYVISEKHWFASNIMGVSFAYCSMQLISPTTFGTATLLLSLLFFYDIYFVFYTPLMVTVATSIDAPIKLLFPRPTLDPQQQYALAMLGLGDVVLPGIMIAMALRFDFWRWCEVRRAKEQALYNVVATAGTPMPRHQLPKYIKPTGAWGERLWNCGANDLAGVFPKTYFWASIGGYIAGMLVTVTVMHIWSRAQPALLYLVPGVMMAVWGTAVVRGEVGMAWAYSEEVHAEEEEKGRKKNKGSEKALGAEEAADEKIKEKIKEGDKGEESGKDMLQEPSENKGEGEKQDKNDDIELVDENGEAEYISVRIVKRPAPGAAFVRR